MAQGRGNRVCQNVTNRATHVETRRGAVKWHSEGQSGILCRSASVAESGFTKWIEDHADWSELVIYTQNFPLRPSVLGRSDDLEWLVPHWVDRQDIL